MQELELQLTSLKWSTLDVFSSSSRPPKKIKSKHAKWFTEWSYLLFFKLIVCILACRIKKCHLLFVPLTSDLCFQVVKKIQFYDVWKCDIFFYLLTRGDQWPLHIDCGTATHQCSLIVIIKIPTFSEINYYIYLINNKAPPDQKLTSCHCF